MAVRIRNNNNAPMPLPFPFRGVLAPGRAIVLDLTVDQVLAAVPEIGRSFRIDEVAGGPFDPAFDNDVASGESRAGIEVETSTARTLTDSDNGKVIRCTNGSAITITVPDTLALGFSAAFVQDGGGTVSLSAPGSLTFKAPSTAASPPATLEDGALIAMTMIDVAGGAERALVFGNLG